MSDKPSSAASNPIVWIDCEMTGLDINQDALIEIAVIVTDSHLAPLGPGLEVVIKPPEGVVEGMSDVVREMHTTSGLLEELDSGTTLKHAEDMVLEHIKQWVPKPRTAPLAGNSIGTDKTFIERDMPELSAHLHYRVIDVSSIKELARRWNPRAYFNAPAKEGGHRALADIAESIDELRYYRAVLFPPEQKPTSALAQEAAKEIKAHSTAEVLASHSPAQTSHDAGGKTGDEVGPNTPTDAITDVTLNTPTSGPKSARTRGTGEAFGI